MANQIIESSKKSPFDYSTPRICNKCGILFSGRGCKDCHNVLRKARRRANPDMGKAYAAAYREQHKVLIAQKAAEYRKQNPEIVKAVKKRTREKNLESIRLSEKKYRLLNRESMLAKAAVFRQGTKAEKRVAAAKYRIENLDKVKAQIAAWVSANPEANRVRVQNRRARRVANGGTLSKGLVDKLLILQKGKCPCCCEPLGDDYHLDHIMPLAKGGSNSDGNMQLLKSVCNMQKHAKDPIDFMQERGFLL